MIKRRVCPTIVCLCACMAMLLPGAGVLATPLDDYVAAPDPSYTYSIQSTAHPTGYTRYVVRLTSQTWRSAAEVNHTLWRHWLTIVIPDTLQVDTTLLAISGGNNNDGATNLEPYLGLAASLTGSMLAFLEQVPNQPIRSLEDGQNRSEDTLIAWSFDKYLATGDATWPALLPMTKSVVRAMDAIADIAATRHGITANKFFKARLDHLAHDGGGPARRGLRAHRD